MSEALRVALVAEGPTDKIVLEAALASMLDGRPFILRQLQPEESAPFGQVGTGWIGVYRWCRQAVARSGGALRNDVLYLAYDALLLHLDADVAEKSYRDGSIDETVLDLPCVQPCPPPSATTNPLRHVLLRWLGESSPPPRTVLCTPSKSMEAWVVAALFPNDLAVSRGIECWPNPEQRLGQQPKELRHRKNQRDYQNQAQALTIAWPRLSSTLDEARRFQGEFLAALPNA